MLSLLNWALRETMVPIPDNPEDLFPEDLAVTSSLFVECQERQETLVPSETFLILERANFYNGFISQELANS
jgi:hypothetical protein